MSERKGERVLNLQSLYRFVVQDICKRERPWWRRVQFSFSIASGTTVYDLTSVTTTPATAMTEILLDEITKISYVITQNPFQSQELVPIFDPQAVVEMVNNAANGTPAPPSRYTINPGSINAILVDPPDTTYLTYVVGWGMPNPGTDSTNDMVPLIPAWGHNTIVAGMTAKIFRFAYGSKNEKAMDSAAEYEQGIQDLLQRKFFDPNIKLQLISSESAVRST